MITERSVYKWVFAIAISVITAIALPISVSEKSLLIMGGIFILAMECMNTAIERVVDDISKDKRELAKQAKDTASAAEDLSALRVGSSWIVIIVNMLS